MFGSGYKYQILGGPLASAGGAGDGGASSDPFSGNNDKLNWTKDLEPKPVKNTPVVVRTGGNTAPRPDNTGGGTTNQPAPAKTDTGPKEEVKEDTRVFDYVKYEKFQKDFVAKFKRVPYQAEYDYFLETGLIKDLAPEKTKELNPEEPAFKIPMFGWLLIGIVALKLFNIKFK